MKVNDAISGVLVLSVAIIAFIHAGNFVTMPGVPYGPSLFPRIVSGIMALGGVLLIISGLRAAGRQPWIVLEDWARKARSYLIFFAIVGCFLFYIFFAETLGFMLVSILLLTVLMAVTRGPHMILSSVVISTVFTGIAFALFSRVLLVPLPLGVLEKLVLGYS